MVPFIDEVLANLISNNMGYLIERSVLDQPGTAGQLIRIDMTENDNLLKMIIFSSCKKMLKNLKSAVSTNQKAIFLKEHE